MALEAVLIELKEIVFKYISKSTKKSEKELNKEFNESILNRISDKVGEISILENSKNQEPS